MPLATGSNFVRGRLADRGHAARNLDRRICAGNLNRLAGGALTAANVLTPSIVSQRS